jgi:hypothetical protein
MKRNGSAILQRCCLLVAVLLFFSNTVRAELPLTVEDLLTGKGKFKLDASLTYSNAERQGVATGDVVVLQTGPVSFVSLPAQVSERRSNTDSIVATVGLRYGFDARAEVYLRSSYLRSETRTIDSGTSHQSGENRLADAWLGGIYQLKSDDATPAVLVFAELAVRERHMSSSKSFKSMMVGTTAYKAIDPVVLSLTATYRFHRVREDGGTDFKPGNLFLLNPGVAFAVNDKVTLTTAMQWTNHAAGVRGNREQGLRRTSSDLLLGLGYGISKESTLNLSFKSNVSGSHGADLRLNVLHTF